VLCAAVAMLSAAAAAKETTIRETDRGLASVVRRECNSVLWTAEVMKQSKINPARLNRLRPGRAILIPDQCATERPSKEVRRATTRLFKEQWTLKEARRVKREQVAALHNKLNDPAPQGEATPVPKGRVVAKQQSAGVATLISNGAIDAGMGALAASLGIWFFLVRRLRRENLVLEARLARRSGEPPTVQLTLAAPSAPAIPMVPAIQPAPPVSNSVVVEYHGESIEFPISVRYVGCCFCSEQRITADPQNVIRHLDRAHPHLRLVERTPAEIRRRLHLNN